MELKRRKKTRPEYNEKRNRLIVFLVKMRGWSYGEIQLALAMQYQHVITRARVQQIYGTYKKKYPKRIFKNYEAPDYLARV